MNTINLRCAGLSLLICACLLLPTAASAQEVNVEDVSFQEVLDRLFGTEETPGLLDGDTRFQFHARGVVLTSEELETLAFFVPSEENPSDFVDLVEAAEQIRGSELKIQGLIDDTPFDFKLSGKQIKLDGISLTQAELDALVEELQGLPGLHEAKIQAFVDGQETIVKMQNVPGRLKIETPGAGQEEDGLAERGVGRSDIAKVNSPEKVERSERPDRPEKLERAERPERLERLERPERGLGRR
jgi:hypothetical protein